MFGWIHPLQKLRTWQIFPVGKWLSQKSLAFIVDIWNVTVNYTLNFLLSMTETFIWQIIPSSSYLAIDFSVFYFQQYFFSKGEYSKRYFRCVYARFWKAWFLLGTHATHIVDDWRSYKLVWARDIPRTRRNKLAYTLIRLFLQQVTLYKHNHTSLKPTETSLTPTFFLQQYCYWNKYGNKDICF